MTDRPPSPDRTWIRLRWDGDATRMDGVARARLGVRVVEGSAHDGGMWAEWDWDGEALTARTDAHAAFPLYMWAEASGRQVVLAGSVDRLLSLGAPRDLDLDALAAFLAVGFLDGTDTVFKHVRTLPPACRLEWRAGRVAISAPDVSGFRFRDMTRQQAVQGVVELMHQAIGRRLVDQPAPRLHALSGGRDSRHLLVELARHGRPPERTVTTRHLPYDWGGDAPYAAAVAERLGVPHTTVAPRAPVGAERRKNRLTSYGSVQHAWFTPVVDAFDGTSEVAFDGNPGGTVLARVFLTRRVRALVAAEAWDELAGLIGRKDDEGVPRYVPLLSPSMRGLLGRERAVARVRAALGRYLEADDPFLALRFHSRAMRELALTATGMLSRVTRVHAPYLDRDLLSFGASIPDDIIIDGLHDEVIATACPALADVPYRPKLAPAPSRAYQRRLGKAVLRLLMSDSDGTLLDRSGLIRRAMRTAARGDDWFTFGRRFSIIVYLAQLERLIAGETPPG